MAGQNESRDLYVLSDNAGFEDVESIRSAVGQLNTVRITTGQPALEVFLYLRRAGDPDSPSIVALSGNN